MKGIVYIGILARSTLLFAAIAVSVYSPLVKAQQIDPDAKKYLQQALGIMHDHTLHAAEVDWKRLSERAFALAANAKTPSETYAAIIYACAQIRPQGQCHLRPADGIPVRDRALAAEADRANAPLPRQGMSLAPSPFVDRDVPQLILKKQEKSKVWAYLIVPKCRPPYVDRARNQPFLDAWAAALRFFLIEAQSADGWIVDLRGNGGGNTWSGMVALGPLLGEGQLGEFEDGDWRWMWFYRDGEVIEQPIGPKGMTPDAVIQQRLSGPHLRLWDMPVAVLFDNATAGSGEQLAIAFAGRKSERSFGVPTKGYPACCANYKLSDGAFLDIELGIAKDRRGNAYPEGLKPDVRIENAVTSTIDPVVDAAEQWLSSVR